MMIGEVEIDRETRVDELEREFFAMDTGVVNLFICSLASFLRRARENQKHRPTQ